LVLIFAIAIEFAIGHFVTLLLITSFLAMTELGGRKQNSLSFQIGFSKTRGFSRTGEAKATFEIKRRKPGGLQVFLKLLIKK
jgi:hypothetical protein